jgi:hypothetical protein
VPRLKLLPARHIDCDRVIGDQQVRHETTFCRALATGGQDRRPRAPTRAVTGASFRRFGYSAGNKIRTTHDGSSVLLTGRFVVGEGTRLAAAAQVETGFAVSQHCAFWAAVG